MKIVISVEVKFQNGKADTKIKDNESRTAKRTAVLLNLIKMSLNGNQWRLSGCLEIFQGFSHPLIPRCNERGKLGHIAYSNGMELLLSKHDRLCKSWRPGSQSEERTETFS